jgi:hypothetical protein
MSTKEKNLFHQKIVNFPNFRPSKPGSGKSTLNPDIKFNFSGSAAMHIAQPSPCPKRQLKSILPYILRKNKLKKPQHTNMI